jgi:hypothetical protein
MSLLDASSPLKASTVVNPHSGYRFDAIIQRVFCASSLTGVNALITSASSAFLTVYSQTSWTVNNEKQQQQ